jgi:hypothetical protein
MAPPWLRRKVQQQSATIQIDAAKDRAKLDARSNVQAQTLNAKPLTLNPKP